ncbi:MAG: cob(I)yrinic acid a,c-diamide adenosyltransferase [Clostridia bacterium]|nr:cob(I)yrinic acid a,c-diamide adenosyltransferase [Clostridia bacterium]
MDKGYVHIYTGDGKGKTTAAVGLGFRAYGRGFRVLLVQFLKNEPTGEIMAIEKLDSRFRYFRTKKVKGFFFSMNEEQKQELKKSEQEAWEYAAKAVMSSKWDMVILDEVIGSINNKLVDLVAVKDLIKSKPEGIELVLTGRNAPEELKQLADYVSEIKAVKHVFSRGIPAREGIED